MKSKAIAVFGISLMALFGVTPIQASTDTGASEGFELGHVSQEYLNSVLNAVSEDEVEIGAKSYYISQYNVTEDVATRNLTLEVSLQEWAETAESLSEGYFESSWINIEDDLPFLVVDLAKHTPSRISEKVKEISPLVAVTIGDSDSQKQTLAEVTAVLQDKGFQKHGISGIGIDGSSGKIVIDGAWSVDEEQDAILELSNSLQHEGILLSQVKFENSSELASDTNRGGLPMTSCTTGFGVRNSSGTKGLITAGHCPNSQSYKTFSSSTWKAMTFKNQLRTSTADLQWHTISATVKPEFFSSSTSSPKVLKSVKAKSQQGGATVCSRGKSSGYRCGTVTSTSYKPTWAEACPGTTCKSVFVRVNTGTTGGDSGGPWFKGQVGYGINKGGNSNYSVYTSTDYFGTLGVAVFYG